MNIVEKLGIRPVMMHSFGGKVWSTEEHEKIRETENQRNEMLVALINYLIIMESIAVPKYTKYKEDYYFQFLEMYEPLLKQVKSATGKSWDEIKTLLEEE